MPDSGPPLQPAPLDLLTRFLADQAGLALLREPDSWIAIRKNARRHGVAPLVAWTARPHVTGSEREWCDSVLAASWRRHNISLADLETTVDVLKDAGIQCLAMKGPVLARRHYQPPFLRKPSLDIDLAVRNADLERAIVALAKTGYKGVWPLAEVRARSHHFELVAPRGEQNKRPGIELHFKLSHGAYGVPVEEFFERAITHVLQSGREVLALRPADELPPRPAPRSRALCHPVHFYEIRKLWHAASPAVRDETLRLAAKHHFAGVFALTDAGFRARWNEPFLPGEPPWQQTWLNSRIDDRLYAAFERLSEPGRDLPLSARLARRWLDFQLTDRPADAMRFAGAMARVAWHQTWRKGWKTVRVGPGEKKSGG